MTTVTNGVRDTSGARDIGSGSGDSGASNDSWYRPPRDLRRFRWTERLPEPDLTEVVRDYRTVAEELLADTSCVEISDDRASELVGKKISKRGGTSFFLVRAVCLNRGTGRFVAYLVGNELLVEHGSLGRSAPSMERQPLVILLARKPDAVYVSYSMAQ